MNLPSVDRVIRELAPLGLPHNLVRDVTRMVLARRREQGSPEGEQPVSDEVRDTLRALTEPSLKHVINATGVVLHTNLGRAPLSDFTPLRGYSNLEYDLATGRRGKRDVHTGELLRLLLGRSAIVVNNNAAAVFLILHELAAGFEVLVSRGELIEIGDGFRIPDIMQRAGVQLREVGATNRTHLPDYESAITDRTRLILRVHPSNFYMTGFAGRPSLEELSTLGRRHGIPVYEDLGSGCLIDLRAQGVSEPLVSESFAAGADVVSFSCDKLLGGPQSGIIAGDAELVSRIRRNPMYRALRVDKLVIEALQTTLIHLACEHWEAIPTLRMLFTPAEELRERAQRMAAELNGAVIESASPIGGGSTPDQSLPTWLVCLPDSDASTLERRLRREPLPVIARIHRGQLVLDMRTVLPEESNALVHCIRQARLG